MELLCVELVMKRKQLLGLDEEMNKAEENNVSKIICQKNKQLLRFESDSLSRMIKKLMKTQY